MVFLPIEGPSFVSLKHNKGPVTIESLCNKTDPVWINPGPRFAEYALIFNIKRPNNN